MSQLTEAQRYTIATMYQNGHTQTAIAICIEKTNLLSAEKLLVMRMPAVANITQI